MATITLSARDIEVALRWTEVHAFKLFDYLYEDALLNTTTEYVYEHDYISVLIYVMKKYDNDVDTRIRVCVYVPPYRHDKLFSTILLYPHQISSLRSLFLPHIGVKSICACGRLGKPHLLASEHATCDNCYIYGFHRGEECSICKEDDGKPWIKTSCGHYFHDMCWYGIIDDNDKMRKCPLCRSEQTRHTITKL